MPEPLRRITGIAAPLPLDNVDTDMIWPASGGSLRRGEQGANALRRLRFNADGTEQPEFILNREPWRRARILITGDNFGCGSSREMAVWALYDLGLRCIIAPRFGDIFYNNCCLNGLLPVRLDGTIVLQLMARAGDPARAEMSVDLETCTVQAGDVSFPFEIASSARHGLLEGLDQLDLAVRKLEVARAFAGRYLAERPWTGISPGAISPGTRPG